jgi:hypothetical protein
VNDPEVIIEGVRPLHRGRPKPLIHFHRHGFSDGTARGMLVNLFAALTYITGGIQSTNDGLSEAFRSTISVGYNCRLLVGLRLL